MAQSFINYDFIFALTCRWKVGVRAVVIAAVSEEDRAATNSACFQINQSHVFPSMQNAFSVVLKFSFERGVFPGDESAGQCEDMFWQHVRLLHPQQIPPF